MGPTCRSVPTPPDRFEIVVIGSAIQFGYDVAEYLRCSEPSWLRIRNCQRAQVDPPPPFRSVDIGCEVEVGLGRL